MRRKPAYTPCKLFYDGAIDLEPGHFLKTPAGSCYLVQEIRRDSKRDYRQHLKCLRWPVEEIPKDAKVHALHWYPRVKKRGRRLSQTPSPTARART
jgi:hypothetical protein